MSIITRVKRMVFGTFKEAKKAGMIVEDGVSIVGGVNFGSEPYLIHLHKHCRISMDVMFITHDGGTWAFRNDNEKYKHIIKYGKIEVGEYSFVGARSTILPGVTIGSYCVVGAGSLVNKDVPDGTVVAGVPAKFICTTEEYAEKCLKNMPIDFDETEYLSNKKDYLVSHFMK